MTDLEIVRGNLREYCAYHCSQQLGERYYEAKHGAFTIETERPDGYIDSQLGALNTWSVSGLTQPSLETLATYTQEQVFNVQQAVKPSEGVIDYKEKRERLKALLPDWDYLSTEEKRALAECFVCSDSQVDSVLSAEEKVACSNKYHQKMRAARLSRWEVFSARVYLRQGVTNGKAIIDRIHGLGVYGKYLDGLDDLTDFMNNSGDYVSNGWSNVKTGDVDNTVKAELLALLA